MNVLITDAFSGRLVGTRDLDEPPREELYGHSGKAFDYDTALDGVPVFILLNRV